MRPEEFFAELYGSLLAKGNWRGSIEMRLIPNQSKPGETVQRMFLGTAGAVTQTVADWSNKNADNGMFFGVGLRKIGSTRGTKQDVAAIPALWADVDTEKMGWDKARTIVACKSHELRPSVIVDSGHGLHLYWFLKDPAVLVGLGPDEWVTTVKRLEGLMVQLAEIFGGDKTHDITRVMRVPGSFNTKSGKPKPVSVVAGDWEEYTLDDLEALAGSQPNWLENGDWINAEVVRAKAQASKRAKELSSLSGALIAATGLRDRSLTYGDVWRHTVYTRGGRVMPRGSAWLGLDEAILRSTALLHAAGRSDDEIVTEVLFQVQLIKQRDAPKEDWDWAAERREIQDKLERFKDRWKVIKDEREAAKRQRRATSKQRISGGNSAGPG